MKSKNKILKEVSKEVLQKLLILSGLSLFLIALSGCTSTTTNQLKESPCKECFSQKPFYCNGVWLEDQSC